MNAKVRTLRGDSVKICSRRRARLLARSWGQHRDVTHRHMANTVAPHFGQAIYPMLRGDGNFVVNVLSQQRACPWVGAHPLDQGC